jgi:hypothetical protein
LRYEILIAVSTENAVFLDVTPCCLVEIYNRFLETCCLMKNAVFWCDAVQSGGNLETFLRKLLPHEERCLLDVTPCSLVEI